MHPVERRVLLWLGVAAGVVMSWNVITVLRG
jgi:hypothetical protein